MAERRRAHRRERVLAQRHLTRLAREQAERQEQDHRQQPDGPIGEVVADDVGHECEQRDDDDPEPDAHHRGRAVGVPGRWRRWCAPLHEQAFGRDEQRDEEHDERQAGGETAQPRDRAHVLGRHRCGDADRDAADVGERQVGEVADRGGAERLDDEEDEQERVETRRRRDEHTRERGEHRADDPGRPPHCDRVGAGDVHQVGVVDHRAHGDAEPRGTGRRGRATRSRGARCPL